MDEQPLDSGSESPNATAVVLEKLLADKRTIADAEVTKLRHVIEWIVVNEVDPLTHDQGPLGNRALRTAGEGSPFVGEFQLMEFSAVLDMSTDSGRSYLGRVTELRYASRNSGTPSPPVTYPPGVPSRSRKTPGPSPKPELALWTVTSPPSPGHVPGPRSVA